MKTKLIFCILAAALLFSAKGGIAMAKNKEIALPAPRTKGVLSLEEALYLRRSHRRFSDKELSLEQVGQLAWSAQGITAKSAAHSFRTAPSAGALYPMEIYLVKHDGLYHYIPEGHKLEVLGSKDLRPALSAAASGQSSVSQAPLDIVICAVYPRITAKYGERGIKYAWIEAGHIAQNIHLEAVALGLASVPVGAIGDKEIQKALGLPGDTEPLYIIPVGYAD